MAMNRTEMNKEARNKIAEIAEEKGLDGCELKLKGCSVYMFLAPAHRKKRVEYSSAEELADEKEWIVACTNCHNIIEDSRELTEEFFKKLRP